MNSLNQTDLAKRNQFLSQVAIELKQELHGIDTIIDRVMDAIRAWYVMPQLIHRPVIVCLWGLTGTGKTQLIRSLARKLGFYDRFLEVQMDGFSNSGGNAWRDHDTISGMLSESAINEGEPGILVLDEFQRFRTVNGKGDDLPVKRYQDIWQLLSDGRLAPSLSFLRQLDMNLAYTAFDGERDKDDDDDDNNSDQNSVTVNSISDGAMATTAPNKAKQFKLPPYEAQELKRLLKLKEGVQDIMRWSAQEVAQRVSAFKASTSNWEIDYSKLLIFVAGNLDELYRDLASQVQDCDTDADVFHSMTSNLSMIDVKKALICRFKPEQVARLGNTHVIYPSLSRATYCKLIDDLTTQYCSELYERSGYHFVLDGSVAQAVYSNGVFPAQGTRPLFSSFHNVLSAPLVNTALWAATQDLNPSQKIKVSVVGQTLLVQTDEGTQSRQAKFGLHLDIERVKSRSNADFRALLAVHEAGHALAYAVLFKRSPQEIKINAASFEGGYNSYVRLKVVSRQNLLDRICVSLSGRAAENRVFGRDASSTGSYEDLRSATASAAQLVRHFGFGTNLSHVDISRDANENVNTQIDSSNSEIETILREQFSRAMELLESHQAVFMQVVQKLQLDSMVTPTQMADFMGWIDQDPAHKTKITNETEAATDALLVPYAQLLDRLMRQTANVSPTDVTTSAS